MSYQPGTVAQLRARIAHMMGSIVCAACMLAMVFSQGRLSAAEKVAAGSSNQRVYFETDVVPLLTRLGCNGGGCHGKATGQNGFKLSLLGFEPDFDHEAIVNEARGRRVLTSAPERSLLLLKALGSVPHGGGRRMVAGSDDYQLLTRWIEQGALPAEPGDPRLQQISVLPERHVFAAGQPQQALTITAQFSDGTRRDVTRQAIYLSNEPDVAEISEAGVVSTKSRSGQFAVMVRYGEEICVFHGTVPVQKSTAVAADWEKSIAPTWVDNPLVAQWKRLALAPSAPASDFEFIRRATLDLCGTLPTVDEVQAYVSDTRPDKRAQLVDRLLERPEYASYFAQRWADILQNRGRGYGTSRQRAGTTLFSSWIRDCLAENVAFDQFATAILTASGSQATNPPAVWYRTVRTTENYVESVAQAFLGVRVQCAQCHHHPAERWSQADYYSLAAVFARVGRKGGFADAEVPTSEVIYLADAGQVQHPRTGEAMKPRPLGGPDFALSRYDDPRRKLAEWMTSPGNPYFARTFVNRMWGHFFGRGIIHPIDDARSTNPPSNPELLDALARDFVEHRYDIKHLIRGICNSYAYGLSSRPNETNGDDVQSFARYYPRRLAAEVLLDAISQTLEAPTTFPAGPGPFPVGTRAIDLPDEAVPSHFLDTFGRPNRSSACECERVASPALGQVLELVSSSEIQEKLTNPKAYPQKLAANGRTPAENAREIFLCVFARPPREDELEVASRFLESAEDKPDAYRSLLWSLLATNEFLYNH